jgi:hypothetical protein
VVQAIEPGGRWKWIIELNGRTKTGNGPTRPEAIKLAELAIDRAPARKKRRLKPLQSPR